MWQYTLQQVVTVICVGNTDIRLMNNQNQLIQTIHMQILHAGILQVVHMIHIIQIMQINNLCN